MSLTELLPAVRALPADEKRELYLLLRDEVDPEAVRLMTIGGAHEAFDAAAILEAMMHAEARSEAEPVAVP